MANFLDTALDIGECFDWMTPCVALARDFFEGPHYMFVVPEDDCAKAHDVLKAGGYAVWHMGCVPFRDVFTFTSHLSVAGQLYDELLAAGVRVLNTQEPPRAKKKARADSPFSFGWGWDE